LATDGHPAPAPNQSYFYLMTSRGVEYLWKYTGIIQVEPFLSASKPICTLVRVVYSAITLIQLLYMICFSRKFLPPPCSVNLSDNISVNCNVEPGVHTFLWLVWPLIMLVVLFPNLKERLGLNLRNFLPKLFFILVIVWIYSNYEGNAVFFLSCTTLMHLFGWLVTLSLFIYTSENLFTFYFLVKEIMLERSILSSCIMSAFFVVSFSSAIHVLRIPSYVGNATYGDTIYNIFATALGTGEFMDETDKDISIMSYHLRITFAIYLCIAVVIILNILTSTMIDRYKDAKVTARNAWRFYAIKSGMHILFTRHLPLSVLFGVYRIKNRLCTRKKRDRNQNCYEVSLEEEGDFLFLYLRVLKTRDSTGRS